MSVLEPPAGRRVRVELDRDELLLLLGLLEPVRGDAGFPVDRLATLKLRLTSAAMRTAGLEPARRPRAGGRGTR